MPEARYTNKPPYNVGDRVKNVDMSSQRFGLMCTVMGFDTYAPGIDERYKVVVKYDNAVANGTIYGVSDEFSNYELIKPNKSIMKIIGNFFTKLTDNDTQALAKAGYINGDLEPTQKAIDTIIEINFFAHKTELVERAKKEIAEEESKKD